MIWFVDMLSFTLKNGLCCITESCYWWSKHSTLLVEHLNTYLWRFELLFFSYFVTHKLIILFQSTMGQKH